MSQTRLPHSVDCWFLGFGWVLPNTKPWVGRSVLSEVDRRHLLLLRISSFDDFPITPLESRQRVSSAQTETVVIPPRGFTIGSQKGGDSSSLVHL